MLAAPTFLGEHLGLAPTQFFWFFIASVSGIILGAWSSGFLAGRIKPKHQIRNGLVVMVSMSVLNIVYTWLWVPAAPWALVPMTFFAYGWALMTPVVTLMALDVVPERRGMASSLQAFIGGTSNGLVAGAIVPLVMHSTMALALTSAAMVTVGVAAWLGVKRKVS